MHFASSRFALMWWPSHAPNVARLFLLVHGSTPAVDYLLHWRSQLDLLGEGVVDVVVAAAVAVEGVDVAAKCSR